LETHSQEAANNTVLQKEDDKVIKPHKRVCVHQLECDVTTLHRKFCQEYQQHKVSLTTFRKLIPNHFKKGKKFTDMCDICEKGKEIEQQLKTVSSNVDLQKEYQVYKHHYWIKKTQKKHYANVLNSLQQNQVVMIMDFKEKIQLGHAPRETGMSFFNRQPMTVLGIFIQKKNKDNIIERRYFDILSLVISQDAAFVKNALTEFFTSQANLFSNITDLFIFTDKGPHFLNKELAHFLLLNVTQLLHCDVHWNLWAAKHGKSDVDGHFGHLSRWYKDTTTNVAINTIEEFIHHITQTITTKKINNVTLLKYPENENAPITISTSTPTLVINNITDFHYFQKKQTENFITKSVVSNPQYPQQTQSITTRIKYIKQTAKVSYKRVQAPLHPEFSSRMQQQTKRQKSSLSSSSTTTSIIPTTTLPPPPPLLLSSTLPPPPLTTTYNILQQISVPSWLSQSVPVLQQQQQQQQLQSKLQLPLPSWLIQQRYQCNNNNYSCYY